MAALSLLALLGALVSADPPAGIWRWSAEIDAAAARCGVPAVWIERVMQAESAGQATIDGRPVRSPRGAIGLMQLMPATWGELRRELGLGTDPDLPADNIVAGACYLRRMYDRFGYPGLFAAYNAGPARYAAWLAGVGELPAETTVYLRRVTGAAPAPVAVATLPPQALFLVRREAPALPIEAAAPPQAPAMFVLRRKVP